MGDCNPDILLADHEAEIAFGQQETLFASGGLTVGGSASITACACRRLGLSTAFVGAVGRDPLGEFMLRELADREVDITGCVRLADVPTGFTVVVSRGQDRAILTHLGAIERLVADHLPAALLSAARHVHISSYFLLRGLRPQLPDLLQRLRAAGTTISLDTNWDPTQDWDGGLRNVLPLVDVFLPNAAEARAIAGTTDAEEAVTVLGRTVPTVVTKLGTDGAILVHEGTVRRHSGYPMTALDTTGAGDAFNAGFLRGRLAGWSMDDCLQLANAVAALSTQGLGAVAAQPDLAEAQALIAASSAR